MSKSYRIGEREYEILQPSEWKHAGVSEEDIAAIESAADALIRLRCTETAIPLYALTLRLRAETGIHPKRRSTDV